MEQLDVQTGFQFSIEDAHVGDDAFVSVEIGIESQGLQRRSARGFGSGNPGDNRFQNVFNPYPFLGAGQNSGLSRNGQNIFELNFGLSNVGMRQVDLVNDRNDGEVLLHRQMNV